MRFFLLLLIAATLLPLGRAHSSGGHSVSPPVVTYVVLRHAEKASDDPRDPTLTAAGKHRAQRIADALAGRDLVAVYSSDYRRTRDTATTSARQAELTTALYDAKQPATAFVQQLEDTHSAGVVLIVGHSNTVPDIVGALCRCAIDDIDESDYGNWFEVRIEDGNRELIKQRY